MLKTTQTTAALAATVLVTGHALAGSVTVSDTYELEMFPVRDLPGELALEPQDEGLIYPGGFGATFYGMTTVVLDSFNQATGLGLDRLQKVTLEIDMNIQGQIDVFPNTQVLAEPYTDSDNGVEQLDIIGDANGTAESGPLFVELPFDDYVGDGGDLIQIDIFDAGMDMTDEDLAFFLGTGVPVDIAAEFSYEYLDVFVLGAPGGFMASGNVSLTYQFDDTDPDPIPTPSAALAGLLGMAGLASRRRRNEA